MPFKPTAVLFDLDNTVYAYDPCHRAGLQETHALARAMHPSFESFDQFEANYRAARERAKIPVLGQAAEHCRLLYFKTMVEIAFGRTRHGETLRLHEAYWQGYSVPMVREPGSLELLGRLRDAGVPTAWVTNFTTERQFLKLVRLGLADAADFLVTSEEVGVDKPAPAGIRRALEAMRLPATRDVVLVGDSLREDGGAAAAAGVTFVWYRREPVPDPGAILPAAIVDSWPQLGELLE